DRQTGRRLAVRLHLARAAPRFFLHLLSAAARWPVAVVVVPVPVPEPEPPVEPGPVSTGALTLTTTASVLQSEAGLGSSQTLSENVSGVSADTAGAVKVGFGELGSLNVTPDSVVLHANVRASPSGSDDPVPSSVTEAPPLTVWSGPAFACG